LPALQRTTRIQGGNFVEEWARPDTHPDAEPTEVHVWRALLDLDAGLLAELAATLAPDELARASGFVTGSLRDRFIVRRGVQRNILGRYLGVAPGSIQPIVGLQGKLGVESGGSDLRFNSSNASGLALVVVAWGREVGVDIEELRPVPDADALVERFFAPGEVRAFRALNGDERARSFLECWTRKEAYLKAIGAGLSMPLNRFEVSVGTGESPRILHADDDPDAADRWTLRDLEPSPDHVGAVVLEGSGARVRLFSWGPWTGP